MSIPAAHLTAQPLGFTQTDEEVLDVLDLPQLYAKPTAKTILATLADLTYYPSSWEAARRAGTPRSLSDALASIPTQRKIRSEGVPSYLTRIISSPLAWIEDDSEKELIWEIASHRLSERSGRTGMGDIRRTFAIPLVPVRTSVAFDGTTCGETTAMEDGEDGVLEIDLCEPALTADNLGLKTWASSYLLAKRLATLRTILPNLTSNTKILELGAGTGLVGIAAAAVFRAHIILTDLPNIIPNLSRNVRANVKLISANGGQAECAMLDWSEPATFYIQADSASREVWPSYSFPLILAADPLYSREHPMLFVQAVDQHLSRNVTAKVIVELPLRDGYEIERQDFQQRMSAIRLMVFDEGEEVGYDDWSDGTDEEELAEVRCWWSVWGWRPDWSGH